MKSLQNTFELAKILALLGLLLVFSCSKDETTIPAVSNPVKAYKFTIPASEWVYNGTNYTAVHDLPEINVSIVSGGTIQVFLGTSNNPNDEVWVSIPSSFKGDEWNWAYTHNKIAILYSKDSSMPPNNPGEKTFKVVVIPPSARINHPNVNLHYYRSIQKEFDVQ